VFDCHYLFMSLEYHSVTKFVTSEFEWFNIREGRTFRHLIGIKGDKDQEPAEMEILALILGFAIAV
jgi:hypothetical protein